MTRETKRILLGVCAVGLVVAAFIHEWLIGHGGARAGLTGATAGGRSVRWDNIPGAQEDVYFAGYLAFAGSLVAAGLLIAIATGRTNLSALARKILIGTTILMAWFCFDAMVFDQVRGTTPGVGMVLGLGAAIGGLLLVRERS